MGQILGLPENVFFQGLKYGAIAGAVSAVVYLVVSMIAMRFLFLGISPGLNILSSMFLSVFGMYGYGRLLIQSLINGAISGAVSAGIILAFRDKLWGNTLFKKAFYIPLIVDFLTGFLFSGMMLFTGIFTFGILLVGMVLDSYVYALIFSRNVEPLLPSKTESTYYGV